MTSNRRTKLGLARWVAEMKGAQRLRSEAEQNRFTELLGAVPVRSPGSVGSRWFLAVLDAVVVAEDHGVYETVYTTLWRFPPETYARAMVSGLPKLIRRMNRHEQVERFLLGLTTRPAYRRAFVAAFRRAPEKDQRSIRKALKEWSRQTEDWEPLLRDLGGSPYRAASPRKTSVQETAWPAKWQRAYADLMNDRAEVSFWEWRSRRESARFAAQLLGRPLGKHWRSAETFTNPLFLSFATQYFEDFLDELARLEPDAQRLALQQLVKVKRHQPPKGAWPAMAARARAIDRLIRARRSK